MTIEDVESYKRTLTQRAALIPNQNSLQYAFGPYESETPSACSAKYNAIKRHERGA